MKIIKHRIPLRRPFASPSPIDETPPRKKALLIGINYKPPRRRFHVNLNRKNQDGVLVGPHSDVLEMQDLLLDTYDYTTQDIVTMLDDGVVPTLQPTRANIMREIQNFVSGAQSGDRFFFLYSGHVEQVENKNNTEEDGMDECLIPVDAKGKDKDNEALMIRDDELKKHLVEALPVGSQLVAVFDSCHSASLLDLDHFRCNRVFVPWKNKGRRKSDSVWNANVRNNAMQVATTRRVYQTRRISSKVVKARKTSIEHVAGRQTQETRKLSIRANFASPSTNANINEDVDVEMEMCDSPMAMWPCDGWCDGSEFEEHQAADVIALASCKDDQISWEDGNGASMTKALVKILQKNPHPNLKDLMGGVSHELHKAALDFHNNARTYRKAMKAYKKRGGKQKGVELDMDNFQDPQLSSHKPLDLNNTKWEP